MASQKVSIRYLIDVAIGNPEPGIVNFNALYTVLQAISEKLALQDENIEIDSSFCPVSTNILESKSNVSSEKLVEHQIFDFASDTGTERVWESKHKQQTPRSKAETECRTTPRSEAEDQQQQQGEDRKVGFEAANEELQRTKKETERLTNYRTELRQHIDALNTRLGKIENAFAQSIEMEQNVECLRKVIDQFQIQMGSLENSMEELREMKTVQDGEISACRKKLEHDRLTLVVDGLKRELDELKDSFANGGFREIQSKRNTDTTGDHSDKTDCTVLQDQLIDVKTNVCSLTEQLDQLKQNMQHGNAGGSVMTMGTFDKEVDGIKHFVDYADNEIEALKHENVSNKHLIDELTTRLDDLSKTKIDKDEIDELLSEKADYTMLQRKVSVENMAADRRKLEKQLAEITDCFVLNEEHVQKQINDIKKFLGDQSLEDMLYDFKVKVDKDIQVVRDAIKRLAEMKPDVDAAAARLRDLQCLSCDQDVVMKAIEMNNLSKFGDAYVSKSISPNVTFEIGKLREAGKLGPPLDLGDALCEMAKNFRHSGGMHTIVTNKDRVSKMKPPRHKQNE